VNTTLGDKLSPWHIIGGWDIYRSREDVLHQGYLGFGKDTAAQLMHDDAEELVAAGAFPDVNDALQAEWLLHIDWWLARGVNVSSEPCFTKSTISVSSATDYPTLAARVKAARAKQILTWACHRAVQLGSSPGATRYQKQRACLSYALLSYYEITDRAGIFLSPSQCREAQCYGQLFLQWYQTLAWEAYTQNRCAWKVRPKLHYFGHTVLELSWTRENPSRQSLFLAEDYVGQIKKVGKLCSRRTVSKRACQRRALQMLARAKRAQFLRKHEMQLRPPTVNRVGHSD
jgi:hypothetical protein